MALPLNLRIKSWQYSCNCNSTSTSHIPFWKRNAVMLMLFCLNEFSCYHIDITTKWHKFCNFINFSHSILNFCLYCGSDSLWTGFAYFFTLLRRLLNFLSLTTWSFIYTYTLTSTPVSHSVYIPLPHSDAFPLLPLLLSVVSYTYICSFLLLIWPFLRTQFRLYAKVAFNLDSCIFLVYCTFMQLCRSNWAFYRYDLFIGNDFSLSRSWRAILWQYYYVNDIVRTFNDLSRSRYDHVLANKLLMYTWKCTKVP